MARAATSQRPKNQGAPYEPVALEYYNSAKHPTCWAFGSASEFLISEVLEKTPVKGARICDVGAGRSVALKILGKRLVDAESVWLVDSSPKMLSWNTVAHTPSVKLRICEADEIDRLDVDFDIIVASLGDPYNTSEFWRAVRKSLRAGGRCLFSTPSFEWASRYRCVAAQERAGWALFELEGGATHFVPSHIFEEPAQLEVVEGAGLRVQSIARFRADQLESAPPKLAGLPPITPIVTLYSIAG